MKKLGIWLPEEASNREFVPGRISFEDFDGILVNNGSKGEDLIREFPDELRNSMHSCGTGVKAFWNKYPWISLKYAGEAMTNIDPYTGKLCWYAWDVPTQLARFGVNLLINEPDIDFMRAYKGLECQVSFSNYGRYIKIFGYRIRLPFTSPIWAWRILDREFLGRFNQVWIHITWNRWWLKSMIRWAVVHDKKIWLYAHETEVKTLENKLPKFLKLWDEVKNELKSS